MTALVLAARREEPSRKRALEEASRFVDLKLIGQGSYGRVYKAWDMKECVYVAIKKFKDDGRDGIAPTTLREIAVLKMLKHDNIVRYVIAQGQR